MGQLYGEFDANTHEWRDGVLADTVRACSRKTSPDLQWVLFDGPVDAIWIENMNTVRSSNSLLAYHQS
jgi:dynein heavy chain, axonemal